MKSKKLNRTTVFQDMYKWGLSPQSVHAMLARDGLARGMNTRGWVRPDIRNLTETERQRLYRLFDRKVHDLDLKFHDLRKAADIKSRFEKAGIVYLGQLVSLTYSEIKKIISTQYTINKLKEALAEHGLHMAMPLHGWVPSVESGSSSNAFIPPLALPLMLSLAQGLNGDAAEGMHLQFLANDIEQSVFEKSDHEIEVDETEIDRDVCDTALNLAEQNEWSGATDALREGGAEISPEDPEAVYQMLEGDYPSLVPVLQAQEGTEEFPALLLSVQLALENGDDVSGLSQLIPNHSLASPAANPQYAWAIPTRTGAFFRCPLARAMVR